MKQININNVHLPKWAPFFITGADVTVEQAKDIIFRTDTSLRSISELTFGGNDDKFTKQRIDLFGWTPFLAAEDAAWDCYGSSEERIRALNEIIAPNVDFINVWELKTALQKELGMVETEYVRNNWCATSHINGPNGWCSPSGKIYSNGHNFGKWPEVSEVITDWKKLVKAFPYIDVVCTMFNDVTDFEIPLCTIVVKDGVVTAYEPDLSLHSDVRKPLGHNDILHIQSICNGNYHVERGLSNDMLNEFAEKSTAAMNKVVPWMMEPDFISRLEKFKQNDG